MLPRSLTPVFIALLASSASLGAQARVVGTVYDSLITDGPLSRATVSLIGTTYVTSADDRGRFRLDSVPAGHYEITFFHATLDSAGVAAPVRTFDVAGTSEIRVALATGSGAALRHQVCPDLTDESTGAVIGWVRDVDTDSALANAEISTSWMEIVFGGGKDLSSELKYALAHSEANGLYVLCGAPVDVPFFLRARIAGQTTGPIELYARNRGVTFQHVAISLRDGAARVAIDSAMDATPGDSSIRPLGLARLAGRITDANGRGVKGARVTVMGSNQVGVANDTGGFRLSGVPAGTQTLEVRAIGYSPARRTVDLATDAPGAVAVRIDRRAEQMPSVQILGSRSTSTRNGFAQRQRVGLGYFFDADRVKRMGGSTAMDLLMHLPGLRPEYICNQVHCVRRVTMRGLMSLRNPGGRCFPNIYVDGMRMFDYWDVIDSFFLKDDVVGVEVYQGYGSIPSQFDPHNGCGSVVIWARQ